MKRIGKVLWLTAAALVVAPTGALAAGQEVAVVDVKEAMKATKHWKQALAKLEKEKGSLEKTLEAKRNALKERAEGIMAQKAVLAPKNFEEKATELELDKNKLAQEFLRSQQQLQALEQGYAGQLIKRIEAVVRQIAFENKYLVIVDAGDEAQPNVLYAKRGIDITKKVIKAYAKNFGDKPLQQPRAPTAARGQGKRKGKK